MIGNQSNTVSVSKNVSIGQLKEKRDHQVDEKKSAQDNVSENTALNKLTEEVQDHKDNKSSSKCFLCCI